MFTISLVMFPSEEIFINLMGFKQAQLLSEAIRRINNGFKGQRPKYKIVFLSIVKNKSILIY